MIGIISSILLSLSAIFLAAQAIKERRCPVQNDLFLSSWFIGAVGTGYYFFDTFGFDLTILINYGTLIISSGICVYWRCYE